MKQTARIPRVFKSVIAPVQSWLLSQGRCVGCGRDLAMAETKKGKSNKLKVTCVCGRVFISEGKDKQYRRALLEEV